MANDTAANKELVHNLWLDLYKHGNYDAVGKYFAEDGLYEDVPAPDAGAVGPSAVTKRLRIGLDPIEKHVHHLHRMVAEGDTVITEHTEDWHFHTGEVVSLPFVSVHVIENGMITLWRDYWDLGTLMNGAPDWWLERISNYTEEDFAS